MTVQEALRAHGVEFLESGHHHSRPGWLQIRDCPFCSSQNYHLGYHVEKHYANCWRCGQHSAYQVLHALKIPYAEIQQIETDEDFFVPAKPSLRSVLKEPVGRGPLFKAHQEYLRGRGLNPKRMEKLWQVEGIGVAARLSWRIYIPITQHGKRVSWTTRAIGNVEQRYISASAEEEAVNHKHLLYGLEYVRDTALVVEGPFDVWNIGPGAVGLFGVEYLSAQVRLLSQIPNRFICFDRSKMAQHCAQKLARELACLPGRTEIVELDADDPGSASKREVELVRRCISLQTR